MRILDITATEGGFIVTFEFRDPAFLFLKTRTTSYFTETGVRYFDGDGRQMGLLTSCHAYDLFKEAYDYIAKRYWDPITHPSPAHKAQARLRKTSEKAQRLLG